MLSASGVCCVLYSTGLDDCGLPSLFTLRYVSQYRSHSSELSVILFSGVQHSVERRPLAPIMMLPAIIE